MPEAAGRDASTGAPDQPASIEASTRPASASNRLSVATTETGESSKRNSITIGNISHSVPDGHAGAESTELSHITITPAQDGRGSHRSHKSRGSGSFLISNSIFEPATNTAGVLKPSLETTTHQRESPRDTKGKVVVRSPEKKHRKNRSSNGLGIGGSPLATTVANERVDNTGQLGGDAAQDFGNTTASTQLSDAPASTGLDVDSKQIVNLALNLSESRRNAARRNVSTPILPTITGFGEGFAGGSLRQYLQAQRRSFRNVSPKPERGDRAFTASPRMPSGQRAEGPLQTAFGMRQDGDYQYHVSASTLARAEKAKKTIELMAQYRRLLQYIPPLKPQVPTRPSTRSPPSSAVGSPPSFTFPQSHVASATRSHRPLGRPYNPLQYIRNRKVRARERKTIDGESQGFGDVDKVTAWIDCVSKESASDEYQASDYVSLPPFPSHETKASPTSSLQSTLGRSQATASKVKRPRVDWITNPADMLADVYWLEQNENKSLIEDNAERKIFPQHVELIRPISRDGEEPAVELEIKKEEPDNKLQIDTKLPNFYSLRNDPDHHAHNSRGRVRRKLHSIAHLPADLNRVGHQQMMHKSHHRSSSESSESDRRPSHSKHRRSATAGSHDLNSDILEKQMLEILAKEARGNGFDEPQDEEGQKIIPPIESPKPSLGENLEKLEDRLISKPKAPSSPVGKGGHRRQDSAASQAPSGRASLEVPGHRGRYSLDGLDSTAPNSPQAKPSIISFVVPSIAIDLSPPPSRRASPTRKPTLEKGVEKVKLKINLFHDRGRNHSRGHSVARSERRGSLEEEEERGRKTLDVPTTPDGVRRSRSPIPRFLNRKTEDGMQSSSKAGSIRRKAEEIPSNIRGLFKSGRNSVARIGDLIWRKEPSPGSVASSDTSSDDSDQDYGGASPAISRTATLDRASKSNRDSSGEMFPQKEPRSYNLPSFTSPLERRGRSGAQAEDTESPESDYISKRQRAREDRRLSRFQLLKPPRIDIQSASPASSPDLPPTNRSSRNSDVSYFEIRRNSHGVQGADARLNAVLGLPGHLGGIPITGLANPEDSRRQSTASKRHWSISDRGISPAPGPMTKREIARVRALILSSGIKAKEITRRANEIRDLRDPDNLGYDYSDIATLSRDTRLLKPVSGSQVHVLAAQVLSNDIQLSSLIWHDSASTFSSQTMGGVLDRVEELQDRILGRNGLSEMTRKAEREADEVSRDLVTAKTMAVKELLERMDKIMRRRRRRFRWLRRGGWVLVEWVLVGVMWWVWLVVVLIGFVRGTIRGVVASVRWLLWL